MTPLAPAVAKQAGVSSFRASGKIQYVLSLTGEMQNALSLGNVSERQNAGGLPNKSRLRQPCQQECGTHAGRHPGRRGKEGVLDCLGGPFKIGHPEKNNTNE